MNIIDKCFDPVGIKYAWAINIKDLKLIPEVVFSGKYRFSSDFALAESGAIIQLKAINLSLIENINNGGVISKLIGTIEGINEENTFTLDQLSRNEYIIFIYTISGELRVLGDRFGGVFIYFDSITNDINSDFKGQPIEVNNISTHLAPWYTGNYTLTTLGVLTLPKVPVATIIFNQYYGDTTGKYQYTLSLKNGNGAAIASGNTAILVVKDKTTGAIIETLTGLTGSAISASTTTFGGTSSIKNWITGNFTDGAIIYIQHRGWINANAWYMSRMPELTLELSIFEGACSSNPSIAHLTLPKGFLNKTILPTEVQSAWAFRLVVESYVGPLCRVRRMSDGTEQDIYAGTNGYLDYDALLTFIGSATAKVAKIYDQSGNAIHQIQNTVAKMPIIAAAGVPYIDAKAGYTVGCRSVANVTYSPDGTTQQEMLASAVVMPGTISVIGFNTFIDWYANNASSLVGLYYAAGSYGMEINQISIYNPLIQCGLYNAAGSGQIYIQTTIEGTAASGNFVIFEAYYHQSTQDGKIRLIPSNNGAHPIITTSGKRQDTRTWTLNLNRTSTYTINVPLFNGLFGFGNQHFHELTILNVSAAEQNKDNSLRDNLIETYAI